MRNPWRSPIIVKFFLSYFAVIIVLFGAFFFHSNRLLTDRHIANLGKSLEQQARLLARLLPGDSEGVSLDTQCQALGRELGVRITVIARNGKVLGDSDEASAQMENHAARPEVLAAFAHGVGSSVRYSTTVADDLLYRAYLDNDHAGKRIVRVAVPLTEIQRTSASLRRTLLVGLLLASLLGLALAYLFSSRMSRRVQRLVQFSREVARRSFPQDFFPKGGRDELYLLEQNLNEMSVKISDNIQELVNEKEKLDSILHCMIEGLLVIDAKGGLVLMNDQARKMFHVSADQEIENLTLAEISRHPEMRRVVSQLVTADLSTVRYSEEVALSEGRWFRVNGAPLQHGRGHLLGFMLVFNDITEIKRLETVRSDFVANVSHELRTPLTAIQGYVETLLRTPPTDPKEAMSFLEIIERHTERLGRLTEDLLTLSDLESGRTPIVHQPVELRDVVQRVLEVFMDRAAKKQVNLADAVKPGLPPLMGAPDRLQQLLINLVDNAIKYTPPGGSVQISARRAMEKKTPLIEIKVSDTGAGIPEKDLPRLTERFYRVDKTRSRELGGTGLGLAIVKHIVQAHGGELKIESSVGKGTAVRVFLPCAAAEKRRRGILFLCTGNSCRSQMAEGFARRLAGNGQRIYSAGTEPKDIHPLAIQVMQEAGVDISCQRSKGLETVPLDNVDLLITLCGEADEACPAVPDSVERVHWPLPDPALAQGDAEHLLRVFREVRDAIQVRVEELLTRPQA